VMMEKLRVSLKGRKGFLTAELIILKHILILYFRVCLCSYSGLFPSFSDQSFVYHIRTLLFQQACCAGSNKISRQPDLLELYSVRRSDDSPRETRCYSTVRESEKENRCITRWWKNCANRWRVTARNDCDIQLRIFHLFVQKIKMYNKTILTPFSFITIKLVPHFNRKNRTLTSLLGFK
jgi:hypothetical protein